MQPGYLYIGIIMVFRVVQNICGKVTANVQPATVRGKFAFIAYSLFLSCIPGLILLFVALSGGKEYAIGSPWEVLIPAISGAALACNTFLGFAILRRADIAVNSMFGTAGLLVPCIAGIFMFDEPMSLLQWLGIVLFMVAAYLLICSPGRNRSRLDLFTVVLLCLQLLGSGATMLCQKAYTFYFPAADVSLFSLLTFAIPMVACVPIVVIMTLAQRKPRPLTLSAPPGGTEIAAGDAWECGHESAAPSDGAESASSGWKSAASRPSRTGQWLKAKRKLLLFGALSALAVFAVNQLATLATNYISSVILFVFINGGNTIIAAIVGALMFRERPGIKGILGIITGVTALIIVNTF